MLTRPTVILIVFVLLVTACGRGGSTPTPPQAPPATDSWEPAPRRLGGLTAVAGVEGPRLTIYTRGGERRFVDGVNLGASLPGHYPGEMAIDQTDYARWFPQMAELGFSSVRVYTIHPPGFYAALAAFNRDHPLDPIYLIQGVWPPETAMGAHDDLLHPEVTSLFTSELERAVRLVHGTEPGYPADVSPWLAGWLIGYEWDPKRVAATDAAHPDLTPRAGAWVTAEFGATPTEIWIASMLDRLASAQAELGTAAPLSFVNWPTTDPLIHPSDTSGYEDLVGIDANHIDASRWPAGMFVSYHAYPYYPDFIQDDARLIEAGDGDPYAGYLAALRDHHRHLPVVVAEFGVPGGWGHAHSEKLGRTHGMHSETDQMRINAEMLETIHRSGLAGALLFEWTDEWFKFTWNTLDFEQPPDRRIMWHNPFGAETWFGVIAVEPGLGPAVTLDGDGSEWSGNGSTVVAESAGTIRQIRMVADPTFLSVRLLVSQPNLWEETQIRLAVDVVEGGAAVPGVGGEATADVLLTLGPGREGRIEVRPHYDAFLRLYRARGDYTPEPGEEDGDHWNPLRLLTHRPRPGVDGTWAPAEVLDVGLLRYAPTDPRIDGYDSRGGWFGTGNVIEARIPHMALGLADPSTHQALRVTDDGSIETVTIPGVGLTVITGNDVLEAERFRWPPWDSVTWHERQKDGIEALTAALATVKQAR